MEVHIHNLLGRNDAPTSAFSSLPAYRRERCALAGNQDGIAFAEWCIQVRQRVVTLHCVLNVSSAPACRVLPGGALQRGEFGSVAPACAWPLRVYPRLLLLLRELECGRLQLVQDAFTLFDLSLGSIGTSNTLFECTHGVSALRLVGANTSSVRFSPAGLCNFSPAERLWVLADSSSQRARTFGVDRVRKPANGEVAIVACMRFSRSGFNASLRGVAPQDSNLG